jgi:hypothetical protein
MLQLIAILVALNTLIGVVWWTARKRAWAVCLAALIGVCGIAAFTVVTYKDVPAFARTDADGISAAEQKARDEAAALGKLREKAEVEIAAIRRSVEESEPEVGKLRANLAASAAEVEQLSKRLAEARLRVSELQAAQSLPRSRELAPPAEIKKRPGDRAVSHKGQLKQHFDEVIEFHKLEQHGLAFAAVTACVELYESSKDSGKPDGPDLGGVTPDGAAAIYSIGAEICQRVDQHERAVEWAQRAVAIFPSPERKALLAVTFLNVKMHAEADRIIAEAKTGDDAASRELRKLLTDFGIIKAARK